MKYYPEHMANLEFSSPQISLKNAYLFAQDGLVVDQELKRLFFHGQRYPWLLNDPSKNPHDTEHARRVQTRLKDFTWPEFTPQRIQGAALLAITPFCRTYYHWFCDLLFCLTENSALPLLIPEDYPPSFQYYLQTKGITLRPLSQKTAENESPFYQVQELILPPLTATEWSLEKVQAIWQFMGLPAQNSLTPKRRVYISRKNVGTRHLLNEDNLWPILAEFGFERIVCEQWSVAEQIALMQEVSHLIAPHGSGLSNMLFLPSRAKILEIRPVLTSGQGCYEKLAATFWPHYQFRVAPKSAPFIFPEEQLRDILKEWFN